MVGSSRSRGSSTDRVAYHYKMLRVVCHSCCQLKQVGWVDRLGKEGILGLGYEGRLCLAQDTTLPLGYTWLRVRVEVGWL